MRDETSIDEERVARRHGLWVFEDAAHGVGTLYKGTHVGCSDRLGVFSLHPIKNITTGEGGVLVTRDDELAKKLRALRFHGLEKQAWNRYAEGGSPQVEVILPSAMSNHHHTVVFDRHGTIIEFVEHFHKLFARAQSGNGAVAGPIAGMGGSVVSVVEGSVAVNQPRRMPPTTMGTTSIARLMGLPK